MLSRSELEEGALVRPQRVLQVFVRLGRVLELSVGGQVLGTTAEHPFWVDGQGWVAAGELQVGDVLVSHTGELLKVEGLRDTDDVQTVYNLEVEEDHTYFVGCAEWGWSVWAHNADYGQIKADGKAGQIAQRLAELQKSGVKVPWAILEKEFGSISSKARSALRRDAEAFGYAREGAKRGPNSTSGHTATIHAEAARLEAAGNKIEHVGGLNGLKETLIRTPGGFKEARRPDILYRTPEGELRGVNVGRRVGDNPHPREVKALADLNGPGKLPTTFLPYN